MLISGHKTESVFERYNIVAGNEFEEALHKMSQYVRRLPTDETVKEVGMPDNPPTEH